MKNIYKFWLTAISFFIHKTKTSGLWKLCFIFIVTMTLLTTDKSCIKISDYNFLKCVYRRVEKVSLTATSLFLCIKWKPVVSKNSCFIFIMKMRSLTTGKRYIRISDYIFFLILCIQSGTINLTVILIHKTKTSDV